MADLQSLDLRRVSASTDQPPSVREAIEVAKLIDHFPARARVAAAARATLPLVRTQIAIRRAA